MSGDRTDPPSRRDGPGEGPDDDPTPIEDLTWVGTADDVLDSVVERDDVLEARLEDLTVEVPLRMGPDAERAQWRFDGTVRINVEGASGPLADWLQWWYARTRGPDG